MIVVTRLNESQFAVNPDLIERIHASPDTTLVMVDGAKFIVTESMADVIEKIAAYRARVIALAHDLPMVAPPRPAGTPQLGLVPPADSAAEDEESAAEPARAVPLHARKK
ncbi:flagellar FlbD family protein [Leifsonia poae]|uniref:flagellar FlbD family protein n=1 Tax=Leifsonia poae TaxID=110933 RepID=UPI001CC12C80|nr:flagellar FlbD family protein [Leifsonia poae]